jgi:uncharacterized membrane protein
MEGLQDFYSPVYQTSLSKEDDAKVRAAFGEEDSLFLLQLAQLDYIKKR